MNQLTNLIPEGLAHALGWTLLHSLWQGAFVALLLSLLLVLLHRHAAKTRYTVAGAAMVLQLLLSSATLVYYCTLHQPIKLEAGMTSTAQAAVTIPAFSFWSDPFAVAQVYFEQHLTLIVTLWLLGFVLMLVRFMGGIAYSQRLRYYRAEAANAQWQQKLNVLAAQLGIKGAIRLVESALVQVPMAIGVAKPVILFPLGAITGLPSAQVEAILAHELAHIVRKDYLLNLLQSIMDMLFFYHPAMWWLSGVVRAERENCCDDIAVALCGNPLTYARALTELEAMRLPGAPGLALAFSGKRGSLLNRVRRLLRQQPLKPRFSDGFAAGLVLITGMLVLSFGATAALNPQEDAPIISAAKDTLRKTASTTGAPEQISYIAQDAAGESRNIVIITNKKGKVKELYVDGKRIPNRDLNKHKDLIEQRLLAVQQAPKANKQQAELLAQQASRRLATIDAQGNSTRTDAAIQGGVAPMPPAPPAPPAAPMPDGELLPPVPPAPPVGASKEELKVLEHEIKQFEQAIKRFEKEVTQNTMLQDSLRKQEMKQHNRTRSEEIKARQEARRQEMDARRAEMDQQRQKRAERMEEVKQELIKDGLIERNSSNLNIHLNNDELFINGKKQPQQVYDKYKKLINADK
ncbi:M56 family metallopeptidase [Pontibacter rugosus]|uniref:M56 family metallopeptidase n=1 Tax=Pontibacter rugosus TaxID=1745966 RepID=A0ABW3SP13_9BACT